MVTLSYEGYDNIKKALNFLKQGKNWDEIFQEAAWAWQSEIESTAKEYLRKKIKTRTGKLEGSIAAIVDEDGDLSIISYHKAAQLIDKGGYSPFPDWNSKTIKEYADIYDIEPFLLARGIFKNQPFAEATNFAWTALWLHKEDIKDEIFYIARRRASEGY